MTNSSGIESSAVFRVCEKLRQHLSSLVGAAGFRSLLSRALVLAKAEVSWLGGLKINPDGSLAIPEPIEAQFDKDGAAKGEEALIAQLLGLLVTFIGEALTLRLVNDIWPRVALGESKSKRSKL